MDAPQRQHRPYERANVHVGDPLRLLAQLRFGRKTWAQWTEDRHHAGLPVMRARICAAESALIDELGSYAMPMRFARGAYLDLVDLIEQQFATYRIFGALMVPEGRLRIKISWDGRKLLGEGNIGFMFNFCDVAHQHNSRVHSHLFAHAEGKESVEDLSIVIEEIGLEQAWHRLRALRLRVTSIRKSSATGCPLSRSWVTSAHRHKHPLM